jgi:hypothetical protein
VTRGWITAPLMNSLGYQRDESQPLTIIRMMVSG